MGEASGSPSWRARPPGSAPWRSWPSLPPGWRRLSSCMSSFFLPSAALPRFGRSGGFGIAALSPCGFRRPSARSRISFGNGRPHAEYAVGKHGRYSPIFSNLRLQGKSCAPMAAWRRRSHRSIATGVGNNHPRCRLRGRTHLRCMWKPAQNNRRDVVCAPPVISHSGLTGARALAA